MIHIKTFSLLLGAYNALPLVQPSNAQNALHRNPRQMGFVTPGGQVIAKPITIGHDGSGLYGPGRIAQQNAQAAILIARGEDDARISDLTLTRAEGHEATRQPGIDARNCEFLIIGNRSPAGAIRLENRTRSQAVNNTFMNP